MVPIQLEGLGESIIVTRLDEISVRSILGNGRSVSYSGDIRGVVDGIEEQLNNVEYSGEHLLAVSYRPSKIFLQNRSITENTQPLYITSIGSLLHYLMEAISQHGGQTVTWRGSQLFSNYIHNNLPASLNHSSFRELCRAYERYFVRNPSWTVFTIGSEAEERMDELNGIYRILSVYSNFFSREHIRNLIVLHDSNFNPVVGLDVTEGTVKSMVDDGQKGKVVLDQRDVGGYKCNLNLQNSHVSFSPALASEMMEVEGEFKLKLRKGKVQRTTRKINTTYELKGDWEASVRGKVAIEIGALAYWNGTSITKADVEVSFEGELI